MLCCSLVPLKMVQQSLVMQMQMPILNLGELQDCPLVTVTPLAISLELLFTIHQPGDEKYCQDHYLPISTSIIAHTSLLTRQFLRFLHMSEQYC